ncbi:hypothetical protein [Aeromonas veronii]|uniref:hypothetical protein n=1 Tax=Aeromonas veronii TaxID=654 RepID=UPI003BA077D7
MDITINQYESSDSYSISEDQYKPLGDLNTLYPQLCIRTNRTPVRTNIDDVVSEANRVADQYPIDDKENRSKAVMEALTNMFGSGDFGHAWLIFFQSTKPNSYTTYAYREEAGYVKNGYWERPERRFHLQYCIHLPSSDNLPLVLENTIIPELNKASYEIANIMGLPVPDPSKGAYTPITNCAWFAGNLWNYATETQFNYEQDFDGTLHADYWGMPFLHGVERISDPGMIAETIESLN